MDRGQTFHRYRLIRRIARGGMAEIFLAHLRGPSGFEKPVAIKKILPVYSGMEEFGVLFRDEARLSGMLEHSAIVQTYEFGAHEGDLFMAMEYVDGPDLEELLDRCRRRGILLPIEVVLHIVHELTRALEYAHSLADDEGRSLAVIHRDVSPPNVLIGVHGEIKLTDFGVAKAVDRESETRPGVLRGKYAYMSPEQVAQAEMDHRSDIFSVGIVLYEALTGVNPFEGSTDFQTMESVERAEVEPAGFIRPDTPTELDRILLACLESDPDLRYQSASDLRRDLAEVIRGVGLEEGPEALVQFLKDVFPERAPEAASNLETAADLGAPPWEHLAHRLAAMSVPLPAVRRDVAARASGGNRIVIGDKTEADPAASTSPGDPLPGGTDPAGSLPPTAETEPGDAHPIYDEWVEEDDNPDRILTQPGVLMRAFASSEQLGPTFAAPPDTTLLPPAHEPVPVRGLDAVPDDVLDTVEERTSEGIPVFNEWDFGEDNVPNLAHDVSLDLGLPSDPPEAPRSVTQPGVTARVAMGAGEKVETPPAKASPPQRRARLRPPGRPRLHPVSRSNVEQLGPVEPLDLSGSHSIADPDPPRPVIDPTEQIPAPKRRPQLSVVREEPPEAEEPAPEEPPAEELPPPPPPPPPRPLWATTVWIALAVLIPLTALSAVNWLDELQREANTPKVQRPSLPAPNVAPLPQRRLEPLPPTRPGATPTEDDPAGDASGDGDGD